MSASLHCNICQLCAAPEQQPGTAACGMAMMDRFYSGYWHNGIAWHVMRDGRILTKSTVAPSQEWPRAQKKNKNTKTSLSAEFSKEHEAVLLEWRHDVGFFQENESLEQFVHYITTHPFSMILEYRIDGLLVGYNWLLKINHTVVHQLFPWKKKQFAALNLGKFSYMAMLDTWPDCLHFLGYDSDIKSKLGGSAYNGRELQAANAKIL